MDLNMDTTNSLYKKYMSFNDIMLEEHMPLEIAAIMVIQGLSFYRSFLNEEDYQRMVKSIYERKDEIQTFN